MLKGAARANVRILVQSGWTSISASEFQAIAKCVESEIADESSWTANNALLIGPCSHDWLFPQVSAVVHHGGAGTTAAGLQAGKPTMICPFFGDQHFWGQMVFNAKLGPKPCHFLQVIWLITI